jgi:hypothetical protein
VTEPPIVPIGRYLGLLPVDRPSGPALAHVVRAGGRRVELTDDEHRVWALAHGVPGAPGLDAWSRGSVRRNLPDQSGDIDVDAVADRLAAAGLLMEVTGPVEEFARSVRLLPQALGLGNDPGAPRTFRIGYPEAPRVAVRVEVFMLWSWAGVEPDLYTACEHAARVARPYGDGDWRTLAVAVLADLHVLLSTNVACLDTTGVRE